MRETLYAERPPQTSRKHNPTPHQRVCTSGLALNRKQNASETQLSAKRINLPLETQHPTNLKWKITHRESIKPSKHS